jgi:hypothetical protein
MRIKARFFWSGLEAFTLNRSITVVVKSLMVSRHSVVAIDKLLKLLISNRDARTLNFFLKLFKPFTQSLNEFFWFIDYFALISACKTKNRLFLDFFGYRNLFVSLFRCLHNISLLKSSFSDYFGDRTAPAYNIIDKSVC